MIIIPSYDCIMYVLDFAHINMPLKMIHLYVLVLFYLLYVLFKHKLPIKNLLLVISIELFYLISYFWATEKARVFFQSTDVTAVLLVFVPVSCLCTARIEEWRSLFNKKSYLALTDIIIVLSLLSKISLFNTSDYMSFSYRLLPLWGICLISALYYGHKLQWLFLGVGIFEGLIYGSRAPLIFIIILAFFTWIVISEKDIKEHKYTHLSMALLFFVVAIVLVAVVLPKLMDSSFSNVSYVLRRLQGSSLFEITSRDQLYIACRKEISSMGFTIHGLFYDRTVLPNGWYSHNFIYEILLSFGWLFGSLFIALILSFSVFAILKQNNEGKTLAMFAVCSFFLRYFFSGSIFDETEFIMFMAILCSLQARNSHTLKTNSIDDSSIQSEIKTNEVK